MPVGIIVATTPTYQTLDDFGKSISEADKAFLQLIKNFSPTNQQTQEFFQYLLPFFNSAARLGVSESEALSLLKAVIYQAQSPPDFIEYLHQHDKSKLLDPKNLQPYIERLYEFDLDHTGAPQQVLFSMLLNQPVLQYLRIQVRKEQVKNLVESDNFLSQMQDEDKKDTFEMLYKQSTMIANPLGYSQGQLLSQMVTYLKIREKKLNDARSRANFLENYLFGDINFSLPKEELEKEFKKVGELFPKEIGELYELNEKFPPQLIDEIQKDLRILIDDLIPENAISGHCSGLSLLYGLERLKHNNSKAFFYDIQQINDWDGNKDTLDSDLVDIFEARISQTIFSQSFFSQSVDQDKGIITPFQKWIQASSEEIGMTVVQYDQLAKYLGESIVQNDVKTFEPLNLFLHRDELINYFNELPNDEIAIFSIPGHAECMVKQNDKIYYYDPNDIEGEHVISAEEAANLLIHDSKIQLLHVFMEHAFDENKYLSETQSMLRKKYGIVEQLNETQQENLFNEIRHIFLDSNKPDINFAPIQIRSYHSGLTKKMEHTPVSDAQKSPHPTTTPLFEEQRSKSKQEKSRVKDLIQFYEQQSANVKTDLDSDLKQKPSNSNQSKITKKPT